MSLCRITNFTLVYQTEHVMLGRFPKKIPGQKFSLNILFSVVVNKEGPINLVEMKSQGYKDAIKPVFSTLRFQSRWVEI